MAKQDTVKNVSEGKSKIISNNSLEDLLQWDGSLDIQESIIFDSLVTGRPSLNVRIRALPSEVISKCRATATMKGRNRATGNITEDLDNEKFQLLVVYNAIIDPDLAGKALQEKFNKNQATYFIIRALFLPGEIDEINSKVFELSGYKFDEDLSDNDVDL